MATTRETADSYLFRSKDGHDWARVFIQSGVRRDSAQPTWWFYISVISTFGTYGHCFTHCAEPPALFLQGATFDHLMNKLADGGHREFSADLFRRSLREWCLMQRRVGGISKAEAIQLWEAIEESSDQSSKEMVLNVLSENSELFWSHSLHELHGEVESAQSRGFFEMVMPQLVEALYERDLGESALQGTIVA